MLYAEFFSNAIALAIELKVDYKYYIFIIN